MNLAHSEQLDQLGAALAKAQAEVKGAAKDSTNPFFKSKYADLGAVWDACREPLTRNGLSIIQVPGFDAATQTVRVTTVLLHASGQWIRGEAGAPFAPEKGRSDAQSIGSVVTYLRRYAVSAFASVCPEDDDGNGAGRRERAVESDDDGVILASEKQMKLMLVRAHAKGMSRDALRVLTVNICGDVSQGVPADRVDEILAAIAAAPIPQTPPDGPQPVTPTPAPDSAPDSDPGSASDEVQVWRAKAYARLEEAKGQVPEPVWAGFRDTYDRAMEKGLGAEAFASLEELVASSVRVAKKKAEAKAQRVAEEMVMG